MSCRVLVSNDIVCNTARVQITRKGFSKSHEIVRLQNIYIPELFMSWSTLYLLTLCQYSGIKYYCNDLTYNLTLFWFLRHNWNLWKGFFEMLLFFLKEKSPCLNKDYVRNWSRMISKLETNENWNKSCLDNSSDDTNLKKNTTYLNKWNESIDL